MDDQAVRSTLEFRACYSYDAAVEGYLPDLVVFPATESQVILLARYAHHRGIPLVPRGAGSGCSGGGICAQGGILVSFERMDRILSLDPGLMVGLVEPGVITARFQREAECQDLFYPPDPSSAGICTLGGNVAHGAGGLRGRKYGTTRDYILGLEAVTAEGQPLRTGFFSPGETRDLTGLLVGSEGTLVMITKIALRLIPRPESFCTLLLVFRQADRAVQMAHAILRAGLIPAAMEFMDQRAVDCVRAHGKVVLPPGNGHILLVEFSGRHQEVLHGAEKVEGLRRGSGALLVQKAKVSRDQQKIWSVRRALSPAMVHAAKRKISQDICVPPGSLSHLLRDIEDVGQKHGLLVITFGHLGDGNLHVNVMADGSRKQMRQARAAAEDLFRAVLALGGTLSGEHGIGLVKARYISWELSAETMAAQRKVKMAFDPAGLLNPGKILGTSKSSVLSEMEGKIP